MLPEIQHRTVQCYKAKKYIKNSIPYNNNIIINYIIMINYIIIIKGLTCDSWRCWSCCAGYAARHSGELGAREGSQLTETYDLR